MLAGSSSAQTDSYILDIHWGGVMLTVFAIGLALAMTVWLLRRRGRE